ncbi:MAG: hypothetical protein PHV02_18795, partial [Rhodocyclaceae bacterium]|nr:hypothetical protein [Rhodocyclaceae bacterium]
FRRRIQGWANTGRHFLRIGFSITPILSNTYRVIRPICARSGLAWSLGNSFAHTMIAELDCNHSIRTRKPPLEQVSDNQDNVHESLVLDK